MLNVYNSAKLKILLVRHTVVLLAVRVTLYLAMRTLYVALGLAWSPLRPEDATITKD